MRRIILLIAGTILMMGFLLVGCGSGSSTSDSGDGEDATTTASGGKPSVDLTQIDWKVEPGIVDGYRVVVFGYTNNTDYEIVDFDLEFKVKDGVTNEQLEIYSELKEKANNMEHDIGEITIGAMTSKCVAPGESVEGCACNLDGTIEYYTDYDSYEVFEPDMMTAVLSDGDKLYVAYYDFSSKKTIVDDDIRNAYTWSKSSLAKALPKPDVRYMALSYDDETRLHASAYGVSREMYEAYVKACVENGFDKNVDESDDRFSAENADGIELDVDYYSSDDEMSIVADKSE